MSVCVYIHIYIYIYIYIFKVLFLYVVDIFGMHVKYFHHLFQYVDNPAASKSALQK